MSYDHDVFISYAHIDNESPFEGEAGWISNFSHALKVRVSVLLGRKPQLWRDPELAGNEPLDDALLGAVSSVAALVTVLSPGYVNSEWCRRELDAFIAAAEDSGGLVVEGSARVFKVIKTPVTDEDHPQPLRGLLGYSFLEIDRETGRERELDAVFGPETAKKLWPRLDDLAHQLCDVLRKLQASADGAPADPALDKPAVYLAPVSADLSDRYEAIRRDLYHRGFRVSPEGPLPLVAEDLETLVKEQIADCRLSLHLVGSSYGVVPEGSEHSIVALQYDAASEAPERGLTRIVWIDPDTTIDDKRQQAFVERLRDDPTLSQSNDLLETSFEDLKTLVYRKLETPATEVEPEPKGPGDERVRIYILCTESDLEALEPLEGFLFDHGFEVTTPVFEGDESEIRKEHEDNLRLCDAAVVFYGDGDELWQRRKLSELLKSLGQGRNKPYLSKLIYVAPPETRHKKRLRTHDALVVRQPDSGFEPDLLSPFLDALKQASGRTQTGADER